MLKARKILTLTLVLLVVLLAFASSIHLVSATTYTYWLQGPFYLNGDIAGDNTVVCNLLWANFSTTTETLVAVGGTGCTAVSLSSSVELHQMTWNSSSALNYTSLIDFQPSTSLTTPIINVFIPDSSKPFSQYTFQVTDFYGMTNPYLRMTVNNASGVDSAMAEQVNLNSAGTPTFIMTQYYTYTLSFICDQGTYSQLFTAENTLTNTLIVLAGSFPITNITVPTADAQRLNDTLLAITYNDPSLSTSTIVIDITHQSGVSTIEDYSLSTTGNSLTLLWNGAMANVNYNVNVTGIINGIQYIWVLTATQGATANPFAGKFDWLGQNTPTMPHVQTGWPEGMTSVQISEIVGASIVCLFLCIGSFRSAGACCILSWIVFGIMLFLGWMNIASPYTIPQFALSGVVALIIHFSEGKDTVREI